jgi:hypothetical protein
MEGQGWEKTGTKKKGQRLAGKKLIVVECWLM